MSVYAIGFIAIWLVFVLLTLHGTAGDVLALNALEIYDPRTKIREYLISWASAWCRSRWRFGWMGVSRCQGGLRSSAGARAPWIHHGSRRERRARLFQELGTGVRGVRLKGRSTQTPAP